MYIPYLTERLRGSPSNEGLHQDARWGTRPSPRPTQYPLAAALPLLPALPPAGVQGGRPSLIAMQLRKADAFTPSRSSVNFPRLLTRGLTSRDSFPVGLAPSSLCGGRGRPPREPTAYDYPPLARRAALHGPPRKPRAQTTSGTGACKSASLRRRLTAPRQAGSGHAGRGRRHSRFVPRLPSALRRG